MRAAAVDVGSAVHQLDRVRSDYDGFAAERSLAGSAAATGVPVSQNRSPVLLAP